MTFTLRQISDAYWREWDAGQTVSERDRYYQRARMLRDKELIASTGPRTQGKATTFTDADVAFAVVALTANLNGTSWGTIEILNLELRAARSTQGQPMFERYINEIRAGKSIFARIDHISYPWPDNPAVMGGPEILERLPQGNQYSVWPVTAIAKPVLDRLHGERD